MPSSVSNAVAATVLPYSLCLAYRQTREWALETNDYANGESQREELVSTSRKSWQISKRLSQSALATLRSFYDARNGEQEAFYFYDVWETSPKFTWDATGVATTGRYKVRFVGGWQQEAGFARSNVSVQLIEVA